VYATVLMFEDERNMNNPELVLQIHKEYVDAGVDYLTTNTFRTTPRAYTKAGAINLKAEEHEQFAKTSLNKAVELSKEAAHPQIKIIGSIAPLEDCYKPGLFPGKEIARDEFPIAILKLPVVFEYSDLYPKPEL